MPWQITFQSVPNKARIRYPLAMIRILILGEITGRPGLTALKNGLEALKEEFRIDYTVANGEGMTNGFGLGRQHAIQLSKSGVDLITGGEKLFYKVDMVEFIGHQGFIIRPANYPPQCPGKSFRIVTLGSRKIAFINLQGNALLQRQNLQNAFLTIDSLLKKLEEKEPGIIPIVQFHAAATAEKRTMLFFLDGRAAAVIGTHTKVLSADETVTAGGTAYISDNGRVGSFMSVGGFNPETEISKLRSQLPLRSQECWDDGIIQGVVVTLDEESGKSTAIERVARHVAIRRPEDKADEKGSDDTAV